LVVDGGMGKPTDTLGGINGWLVANGAPDEAVAFPRFLVNPDTSGKWARAATSSRWPRAPMPT
jgi:raffinose/stachyose/melibiose transport system substrate-binding protein